ncbi:MAG: hypothetical protein WCJ01_00215 [Ignavibacteria bacterium]
MGTRENNGISRIQSLLPMLSKSEIKAVTTIIESLAGKREAKENDPFLDFLENVPEEEPTKEETELIGKARRSKKNYSIREIYG